MAREVISTKDVQHSATVLRGTAAAGTSQKTKDEYLDRLLKYIPAEVVALYLFILGIIQKLAAGTQTEVIHWVVFVIFVALTWFYLRKVAKVTKTVQLLISTVAFIIWVFAIGGPFALFNWYDPVYGEILVPIYTFLIAIIEAE